MNPQDLIALAKEIYIHRIAVDRDWDQQKIAREAIEAAKQFALALQSEKEGSASQIESWQHQNRPKESPKASTSPSLPQHLVAQLAGSQTQGSNQMAAGRGMVRQRQFGLEMG